MTFWWHLAFRVFARTQRFGAPSATERVAWPLGVGLSVRAAARGLAAVTWRNLCEVQLNEYVGGADTRTVDQEDLAKTHLSAKEFTADTLPMIPSFFDNYSDIHCLASCNIKLKDPHRPRRAPGIYST